jgi:hypothetical protein
VKDLVTLFRARGPRLCRDCGDCPCICNADAEWRDEQLRRALRAETEEAFAHARASQNAFLTQHGGEEAEDKAVAAGTWNTPAKRRARG